MPEQTPHIPAHQAAPLPKAVLIRTPNWLGDLMMATGFIRAALEMFPGVRIDLIVRAGFERLPLPRRGEIRVFDRKTASAGAFGKSLRGAGYSHFFVLPPSFSSAWMAFRSGIPHRIGYAGEWRSLLLRPALRHSHAPRSVHLVREYLDLLAPWGHAELEAQPAGLDMPPEWVEKHLPERLREHPPYVVLAPGAEYGPAKQWPDEHYRETARALADAGWPVVVAGLAKDRELGAEILAGLAGGLNLCGETGLLELTALLARARLLISNDSGAMHMAAAAGIPQIALFGSTNPHWTAPLNPRAVLLQNPQPCAPCYRRTCPLGHLRCLQELPPGRAVEAALKLLAE
ncbi:MAG: lipopolysaccharide heptosyltransferase II [Deltaproteobacteria bacterium]|nr:lipopolysaccharide heptosyltransferase II [Deltaproteobacteria bacterium]